MINLSLRGGGLCECVNRLMRSYNIKSKGKVHKVKKNGFSTETLRTQRTTSINRRSYNFTGKERFL